MDSLDQGLPHKNTISWPTVKVPHTLYRPIVLAVGFVELDTEPLASLKGSCPNESDDSATLRNRNDGPK